MEAKDLVLQIIRAVVNIPDEVNVERTVDNMGVLLTIDIARTDAPLLIGKQGKTINAVRTIARIVGIKNKEKINIKINEPWDESKK